MTGTLRGDPHLNGTRTHEDGFDDRPLGQIVSDLTTHAQELVRGEVDLAKAELVDKAKTMGIYIAMAVGAAVLALVALGLFAQFLAHALAQWREADLWAAYGIVFVLYAGVALALGVSARKGIRSNTVVPADSIDSAKEDIAWVKART